MSQSLAAQIHAANTALLVEGDLDRVGEFFTPSHVAHLTGRDMEGGHAGVRGFVGAIRRAFSDLQVEVSILLEGEDRVSWQRTIQATHRAAFQGFPASGGRVVWRDMGTSRFREGRVAEEWVISDLAEQLLRARQR